MNRRLIIVRHAHRKKNFGKHFDNGISDKGHGQVDRLLMHWAPKLVQENVVIVSSPKLRCLETVKPLADKLEVSLKIDPLLDEQQEFPRETTKEFESRIRRFARWWKRGHAEIVIACTHGDWIPSCTGLLLNEEISLKKGRWLEIVGTDEELSLIR